MTDADAPNVARRHRHHQAALLAATAVELLVLTVTGIALFFEYRPVASSGLGELLAGAPTAGLPEVSAISQVRGVHRLAGYLSMATAAGVVLERLFAAGPVLRRVGSAVAVVAVTVAAVVSGFALAWDQLGLRAGSVPDDLDGFRAVTGDAIRFALVDGREVTPTEMVARVTVHGVATAIAIALVATPIVRGAGRRSLARKSVVASEL